MSSRLKRTVGGPKYISKKKTDIEHATISAQGAGHSKELSEHLAIWNSETIVPT